MLNLFNSKLTLQTVLAILITTLATAAIVSATTIGNNISTDGTLTVTGNTGIGTTSPSQKLSVTGKVYTTGGIQFPDGSLQTAAASAAASSLAGQIAFYNTDGSTVSGTSTLFIAPTGYVGIGTSSPYAKLSVVGPVVAEYFYATSTTATSTFAGGLDVTGTTLLEGITTFKNFDATAGTSVTAFGDSFTTGVGVTSAQRYINVFGLSKGWTVTNLAVSGSLVSDQASAIYGVTPDTGSNYTYFIGVNDEMVYTNSNQQDIYRFGTLAELSWLGMAQSQNKLTARDSSVVKTGSWTNTSAYGIGMNSITPGDILTTTVYGKNVLVGYIAADSNNASFSITVDGVNYGTYNNYAAGTINYTTHPSYAPQLAVIPNLSDTIHTVVITVVTASSNNYAYIDWIAGTGSIHQKGGPNVFVLNIPRQNGYSNGIGGSDANVLRFNEILQNNVSLLASMGLNVTIGDVAGAFNITTDLQGDGLHPSVAGHTKIANILSDITNSLSYARDRQISFLPIPNIKWDPTQLSFSTENGSGLGFTEKMRITQDGKVGISTTSPSQKLSITGKVYTTGGIQFSDGSLQTAAAAGAVSALQGQVAFYNTDGSTVSGTSAVNILPSGYVGIGTTTPQTFLTIQGAANSSNGLLKLVPTGQDYAGLVLGNRQSGANAAARSWEISSNFDNYGDLVFIQSSSNSSNPATGGEKVVFSASGKVGIGITNPTSLLHLASTTADAALTFASGPGNWIMGIDYSDGGKFKIASSTVLGTSDRLTIDTSGLVGIGTSTPAATLDIEGYMRLKKNTAQPVACSTSNAGAIALSSSYLGCVCNGTGWINIGSSTQACVW